MPHLASTAWIWALQLLRIPTSLARCRTSSRSSRVAGGAIHASGSRPIRSRSARSRASRSSFFTRRYSNALTPNGCARCTWAPSSCRASTAQYQPYVASSTTSGASPARAITVANRSDVVADPDALQRITVGGHPDDHRPSPVQIDSHELLTRIRFAHKGPPSSNGREHRQCQPNPLRSPTRSGGPAPSSHQGDHPVCAGGAPTPQPVRDPGERVVHGQRMMQAASDIFLGWTKGVQADRYLYLRQLRDMKGSRHGRHHVRVRGGRFYAGYVRVDPGPRLTPKRDRPPSRGLSGPPLSGLPPIRLAAPGRIVPGRVAGLSVVLTVGAHAAAPRPDAGSHPSPRERGSMNRGESDGARTDHRRDSRGVVSRGAPRDDRPRPPSPPTTEALDCRSCCRRCFRWSSPRNRAIRCRWGSGSCPGWYSSSTSSYTSGCSGSTWELGGTVRPGDRGAHRALVPAPGHLPAAASSSCCDWPGSPGWSSRTGPPDNFLPARPGRGGGPVRDDRRRRRGLLRRTRDQPGIRDLRRFPVVVHRHHDTVGYGDIVPETLPGRMAGVMIMLTGSPCSACSLVRSRIFSACNQEDPTPLQKPERGNERFKPTRGEADTGHRC